MWNGVPELQTHKFDEFPLYTSKNRTGFSFKNCLRNNSLKQPELQKPNHFSTGTTIAGVVYKDGVIIGTDSRDTYGRIATSTTKTKIFRLQDNIFCAGCGNSVDAIKLAELIEAQLELHRLNTDRIILTQTAARMLKQVLFRFGGELRANYLLGGVHEGISKLYVVYCDGGTDMVPFASLGSGFMPAMGILEAGFQIDMDEASACDLIFSAVKAGILQDPYSGNAIHMCVLRSDYSYGASKYVIDQTQMTKEKPLRPDLFNSGSFTKPELKVEASSSSGSSLQGSFQSTSTISENKSTISENYRVIPRIVIKSMKIYDTATGPECMGCLRFKKGAKRSGKVGECEPSSKRSCRTP